MPDKEKMQKLADELTPIVNKYIDTENMTTEDVFGSLCGVAFKVVKASQPAEAFSGGGEISRRGALESNLDIN